MAQIGYGYGSEFQLLRFLGHHRNLLEEAIRKAIFAVKEKSIVLITGKGNETRQKRGIEYIPCPSDVEYTKKFLKDS